MFDFDDLVDSMMEEKGFNGVEMYNDKYPSYQDNGGEQTGSKHEGAINLSYGNSSEYAKHEDINYTPDTHGRPNIEYGGSYDFADYEDYPHGGAGHGVVYYGRD